MSPKEDVKTIKYYTVYLEENDKVIAFGTAKECAKAMNISYQHFLSIVSKWKHGKRKKYALLIENIALGSEEEN